MAKKVQTVVKMQIPGGQATPAPPVGTALGPHGINIQDFVSQFNERTEDQKGNVVPVELYVYEDRSFDFKLKTPPASDLLKKAAGTEKGSGDTPRTKVGKVSKSQVREIAETKMEDLSANNLEQAEKIIEGTAKSMGIDVKKK